MDTPRRAGDEHQTRRGMVWCPLLCGGMYITKEHAESIAREERFQKAERERLALRGVDTDL